MRMSHNAASSVSPGLRFHGAPVPNLSWSFPAPLVLTIPCVLTLEGPLVIMRDDD